VQGIDYRDNNINRYMAMPDIHIVGVNEIKKELK